MGAPGLKLMGLTVRRRQQLRMRLLRLLEVVLWVLVVWVVRRRQRRVLRVLVLPDMLRQLVLQLRGVHRLMPRLAHQRWLRCRP